MVTHNLLDRGQNFVMEFKTWCVCFFNVLKHYLNMWALILQLNPRDLKFPCMSDLCNCTLLCNHSKSSSLSSYFSFLRHTENISWLWKAPKDKNPQLSNKLVSLLLEPPTKTFISLALVFCPFQTKLTCCFCGMSFIPCTGLLQGLVLFWLFMNVAQVPSVLILQIYLNNCNCHIQEDAIYNWFKGRKKPEELKPLNSHV